MKSLIVRLSVLVLTTTGFAASTLTNQTKSDKTVRPTVIASGTSLPGCSYSTPCGID